MSQNSRTNTVSRPSEASTISEDLTIIGDVTSNGELRIDGRVQGNVHCLSLILGESSEIKGDVKAEEVLIRGRLIGSVRGRRVMLQSTAHVEGDLLHKTSQWSRVHISKASHVAPRIRSPNQPKNKKRLRPCRSRCIAKAESNRHQRRSSEACRRWIASKQVVLVCGRRRSCLHRNIEEQLLPKASR